MYGGNVKKDLTSNDQKWIPVQSVKQYLTHKEIKLPFTQIHVRTRKFQTEGPSLLFFVACPSEERKIYFFNQHQNNIPRPQTILQIVMFVFLTGLVVN